MSLYMPAMPPGDQFADSLDAGELFRAVVDHQQLVCLMVDASAKPFDSSTAGIALLDERNWLKLGSEGKLVGASPAETSRLHALTWRAAHGRIGGSMRIRNESGRDCLIYAIPPGLRAESSAYSPRACCALFLVTGLAPADQEFESWIDVQKIQVLLKCTKAAEVAALLLAGLAPVRIAKDRKVSLSTVRSQIRALLEASGTRRVPELIVLLARSL